MVKFWKGDPCGVDSIVSPACQGWTAYGVAGCGWNLRDLWLGVPANQWFWAGLGVTFPKLTIDKVRGATRPKHAKNTRDARPTHAFVAGFWFYARDTIQRPANLPYRPAAAGQKPRVP